MKERWQEMLEYEKRVQEMTREMGMTDLERARSELLDIMACARDGLWTPDLVERLDEAVARQVDILLAAARREGYEEAKRENTSAVFHLAYDSGVQNGKLFGAEEMRERTAGAARDACLVPPDGGSPTEDERLVCEEAERRIRALPLTPEEPT